MSEILERRHGWNYQDRPTFFYNPACYLAIMPDGKRGTLPDGTLLADVLDRIEQYVHARYGEKKRAATLFVRAGNLNRNRPKRWYFELDTGWKLENFKWSTLQGTYHKNGFTIWLYGTGKSFGESENLTEIRAAFYRLEQELRTTFSQEAFSLRPTPAQTGKELLSVSLPASAHYPCLPDDLQELIRGNSTQGRIEHFDTRAGETLETLYILDGRFMYAACCDALPTGEPVRDGIDEFYGKPGSNGIIYPASPGFYRVVARVPDTWQHIGLLKAASGRVGHTDASYYPRQPGFTFENWTTANELSLALNNGWNVRIAERLLFPYPQVDPLATWLKKLRALREQFAQGDSELDKLMAGYIRQIVLHTVGSFHAAYRLQEHLTPFDRVRAEMKGKRIHGGDKAYRSTREGILWIEEVPLAGTARAWMHPEFSATVYGRARTRLATFALRLPFQDIVAFNVDCVYSACCPSWVASEDTGKPGRFRQKGEPVHSFTWPHDWPGMRKWIVAHNLKKNELSFFPEDLEAESE